MNMNIYHGINYKFMKKTNNKKLHNSPETRSIAFFDFDGTVTRKDSLADFIQYTVGKPTYYIGLLKLSPILMAYTFKLIPNYIAKEKLITYFFKGWDINQFKRLAEQYSLSN